MLVVGGPSKYFVFPNLSWGWVGLWQLNTKHGHPSSWFNIHRSCLCIAMLGSSIHTMASYHFSLHVPINEFWLQTCSDWILVSPHFGSWSQSRKNKDLKFKTSCRKYNCLSLTTYTTTKNSFQLIFYLCLIAASKFMFSPILDYFQAIWRPLVIVRNH